MKPLKITQKNAKSIEDALKAVNGRSEVHCYTAYEEISELVDEVTSRMQSIGLPKSLYKGAVYSSKSGGKAPNCYKGISRNATGVVIERKATGWFLKEVYQVAIFKNGGGSRLSLTAEQADAASRNFSRQFSIVYEHVKG
jgi:hypothetical protein